MKIGWGECGTRSATGRRPGWASRLLGEPQWLVIRVSSQSLSLAAPHAGIAHSALLSLRTLPSLPSGPAHAHCLATLTCPSGQITHSYYQVQALGQAVHSPWNAFPLLLPMALVPPFGTSDLSVIHPAGCVSSHCSPLCFW